MSYNINLARIADIWTSLSPAVINFNSLTVFKHTLCNFVLDNLLRMVLICIVMSL